jgi:MinD-like ATPase involved in chromosome partitioning or flagellar assembly
MRIAVVNFCGTVGKTTVASHLLAPRLRGAEIFAVETVNETAADLGLEVSKLKGSKFGDLFKVLLVNNSAIVDVGASNAEEFIGRMGKFDGSHLEIDYFVIPVTPGTKEQLETIKTIKALTLVGVPAERIRVLFNRVQDEVADEFKAIIGFAKQTHSCVANADAAIHENEVFNLLTEKRMTIAAVMEDETDYKALIRTLDKEKDAKKIQHAADMHAIKSLARAVKYQLDTTYENLFKAAA